jgi:hypothetical protein
MPLASRVLYRLRPSTAAIILSCSMILTSAKTQARSPSKQKEAVVPPKVLHVLGLLHGFLILKTPEGQILADGELTQVASGDRIKSRLLFHFKDTSIYDETLVFSQRRVFRLISYRLIQKGPIFKSPMEFTLDGLTGQAAVHYTDGEGQEKTENKRLELPADVANGLVTTLVLNIPPNAPETTVSFVAATPRLRIVKLHISPEGQDWFSLGNSTYKAQHFVVKVEIPGVAGIVAPIVGKKPEDTDIWVLGGEAPVLLKSEGPLFVGGPIWRIELASPVWPSH